MQPPFRFKRLLWTAAVLLLQGAPRPAAAQVIDTFDTRGSYHIINASNQASGQTFFAPAGFPVLDSFHLTLLNIPTTPTKVVFRIQQWSEDPHPFGLGTLVGGVGPVLYEQVAAAPNAALFDFTPNTTFSIGGLSLTPGQKYVAYVQEVGTPPDARRVAIATTGKPYANGGAVSWVRDGGYWTTEHPTSDWQFRAEFSAAPNASPVPEPISLALFAPGLAVVALLKRRRSRSSAGDAGGDAEGAHGYSRVTDARVD